MWQIESEKRSLRNVCENLKEGISLRTVGLMNLCNANLETLETVLKCYLLKILKHYFECGKLSLKFKIASENVLKCDLLKVLKHYFECGKLSLKFQIASECG